MALQIVAEEVLDALSKCGNCLIPLSLAARRTRDFLGNLLVTRLRE
jgi:hypothetical protein